MTFDNDFVIYVMVYLQCRIRTRIQTRIQNLNAMATLHYTEVFILHGVRIGFEILTVNYRNGIGI